MKKYISISKKSLEKTIDKLDNAFASIEVIKYDLQAIQSITHVTDEEIELIEKLKEILISKIDLIDNVLEDDNNEFYKEKCYESEI